MKVKTGDKYMSNNIVGIVSFLITMTMEDEFNKIKYESGSEDLIQFPRNEDKKEINKKIKNADNFDKLPDMLIRSDYTGLFHKKVKEALDSDIYENVMPGIFQDSSEFGKQKRGITMLGAKQWVIVVDRSIDSSIKSPEHWGDLLDEQYRGKIGIQGKKDKFCGTLLLQIYKDYGENGLIALAKNIKNVWHFTSIIKALGKGDKNAAPINVMPLSNAMMILNKKPLEIIWPEEGALAIPIYMLVKKEKVQALDSYIKYVKSDEFQNLLKTNHFYSIKNCSENKKLKWLEWDYINSMNIALEDHKDNLNNIFRNSIGSYCIVND